MEYLIAEGDRLRSEYEESLRVQEEEKRQTEEEQAEQERIREEEQFQQDQLRIEEERRLAEAERKRVERCSAAELLLEFSEQAKDQETQKPSLTDECVQTDQNLLDSVECLKKDNDLLKKRLKEERFSVDMIQGDDRLTKFYTGLPTWGVFLHLFCFLSPFISLAGGLCLEDGLFLTLVRLRLGLFIQDIAHRFKISPSIVSRTFQKWLDVMFVCLTFLISWPDKEINRKNMPTAFKELYPNCRCVIDCSEIFIETPKNFDARSKTYSNYKKHNTIKFLIGITPCGSISFLSECWGGRVSDKTLTQESNFFNLVEHGDTILADI